MDVKFLIEGKCWADNIDNRRSEDEIAETIEKVLEGYVGIKAVVKVYKLKYINQGELSCVSDEEGEQNEKSV